MKRLLLLVVVLLVSLPAANAQYKFTSLDFPGGTLTTARGINDAGTIVGAYRIEGPRHALLIKRGQFIPLAPTTILGTIYSEALKSNPRGDVVGYIIDADGKTHGFLLSKGVVTILDFQGADSTFAFGINESGTVVGSWQHLDADGNLLFEHGFSWNEGTFSDVNFPDSDDTAVIGINALGDLVGTWGLSPSYDQGVAHGFVRSKGHFTSFDVPFANTTFTQANDINLLGHIVGVYTAADGVQHGFLAVGTTFSEIVFPGAAFTTAWGINSLDQIVGRYNAADESQHGFLAQPEK